jgi:outer membrane biosynthesis protein TonB
MRTGATLLSAIIHTGIVVAGLIAFTAEPAEIDTSTMISIPLELVTIGDVTDIAPVTEDAKIEDEAKPEEAEVVASAAPTPPPVQEDTVALDPAQKDPKKEEPKKQEAKPAPASRTEQINSVLDGILAGVTDDKPKKTGETSKATNIEKGQPRMGAGEQRKMVASVTDYIRAQLVNNRCWTDHSDMADAQRLHTTIRVWFGRNGKFSRAYELQSREPSGDPQMQVFVAHARRALDMCNTIGWIIPEQYFQLPQPQYIDITFVPQVGSMK